MIPNGRIEVCVGNLRVKAIHGLKEEEKHREQTFILNITTGIELSPAIEKGFDIHCPLDALNIDTTFNYSAIRKIALRVMAGPPRDLLEQLADEIAVEILIAGSGRVNRVEVWIGKLDIWDDAVPQVHLTRTKGAEPWRAPVRI